MNCDTFIDVFCRYFNYNLDNPEITSDEYSKFIRCLEILLMGNKSQENTTNYVYIEQYGKLLDYFGPIMENGTKVNFLKKIKSLIGHDWFYGHINTETAIARLRDQYIGYYLVRFSTSERGYFTISQVTAHPNDATKKKIQHTRVRHRPLSSEYFYQNRTYPSLESLIEAERDISNLLTPCPGSDFSHILSEDIVETGYTQ